MPGETDHKKQADHNKLFFDTIWSDSNFPDWIVTAGFYTALHCIDVILARDSIHPQKHDTRDPREFKIARNKIVARHPGLAFTVSRFYIQLYQWSMNARYEPSFLSFQNLDEIVDKVKDYLEMKILPLIQ